MDSFKSIEEYKSQVFQNNVSSSVENFVTQKLGQEAELNLQCSFIRTPVEIPIRHKNISNIECIFDLKQWLEFFESKLKDQSNFSCPGCKQYVYFSDFGIDFTLYHILTEKKKLEQSGHKYINGKAAYFSISKIDKKTRIKIPGAQPISRTSIKNNNIDVKNLNPRQQEIFEETNYTIQKLLELITKKMYKAKQQGLQINILKQSLQTQVNKLKNTFKESQNLIELGVKSLETQFVFGLKKLERDGKYVGSLLIVYYPHLGIWADYEIKTTPEKHFQYEYQLYAKEQSLENENIIYVVGGRIQNLVATNLFVRIRFPKDPFSNQNKATIEYLPNLPSEGFNYLGGCYNNKVYIFCGQKRTADETGLITDIILDTGYVFMNGQWNKINQKVEKRFDGSYTIIKHQKYDKCLLLYGGTSKLPDGRAGFNVPEQQHLTQVFSFQQEKFLGNGFMLKFSDKNEDRYQKYMLASPIFSIPFGAHSELLISGQFLKKNWKQRREVYIFDWEDGTIKINQLQNQPLQQSLLSYNNKNLYNIGPEFLQPVQDAEGAFLFGNYYTIHNEDINREQKASIQNIQLFEYKVANGQVSTRSYIQREDSIKLAIEALSKLADQENKKL